MESFSAKQSVLIYVKGMAMGAADIVPGVSGGTIALITGIFQPLIESISKIGPDTIRILYKQGIKAAWQSINGTFLLLLFAGILSSVFTLSRIISWLLVEQTEILWSFFFGLILVSAYHVGRKIKRWHMPHIAAACLGAIVAFLITSLALNEIAMNPLTVFLAGSIAICAMVLPGISGSFILLMMGMYAHILAAVKGLDVMVLLQFAAGCVVGLLLFTRFLAWLFRHHESMTLAVLTGVMVGSLNKVWPWKQTLSFRVNSHGEQVPLEQVNVLPQHYFELTGQQPEWLWGIIFMLFAIVFVLALEKMAEPSSTLSHN